MQNRGSVKRVLAAVLVWLALPGAAHAGDATIVGRDLPLGPVRSLDALRPTPMLDLVGLHWQGSGTVSFRTRSLRGRWSAWRRADVDDHVAGGRGWRLGEPYWTGPSDRLDYRIAGTVRRLRAYYVWSPVEAIPYRTE